MTSQNRALGWTGDPSRLYPAFTVSNWDWLQQHLGFYTVILGNVWMSRRRPLSDVKIAA